MKEKIKLLLANDYFKLASVAGTFIATLIHTGLGMAVLFTYFLLWGWTKMK